MKSRGRKRAWKIAAALVLLAMLYLAADWRQVGRTLASLHLGYLAVAMCLFVPQTLLSAWRWRMLAAPLRALRWTEALQHTAIASAWNLLLPSKLGDLSKAALVPELNASQRAAAGGLVVLEKLADVAALAVLIVIGVAGQQGVMALALSAVVASSAQEGALQRLWERVSTIPLSPRHVALLAVSTLTLWCLHLWQIELLMRSAGVFAPWDVVAARLPVAIFAGLLPISFCGVGTRDAALVWLFADVAPAPAMAAVGLLTALRYLVPGAFGIAVMAAARGSSSTEASA